MITNKTLHIIKKADDVDVETGEKIIRISIGGSNKDGYYIVYRGDLETIKELMSISNRAVYYLKEELPVSPSEGKKYS